MYRGWTQTDYQNKHYSINQKDEGTWDDRGRDGGTNFILRIKEQKTRLTLQERDDDDDDDILSDNSHTDNNIFIKLLKSIKLYIICGLSDKLSFHIS